MTRILALFIMALCFTIPAHAARELPKPELLAVYVYADWCPNCKILGPMIEEARVKGELDKKKVLFIPLNLTDKTTINQSILMAQQLGIGDFLKAQGSGTGYLALLDPVTKEEKARFLSDSTPSAIQEKIQSYLSAAP
jgi:thiol-disulfide isomerase/thioredoxin